MRARNSIDHFADLLSEEFNKPDPSSTEPGSPIVYNTCTSMALLSSREIKIDTLDTCTDQCYLRTTPSKLQNALAHASSNNYSFGAKLVRGAYVESERKRHSVSPIANSEPCIVWNSKDETDHCYDSCASILESRIDQDLKEDGQAKGKASVGVCLASHNGTSMRKFLGKLREDGLVQEGQEGRLQVDDRVRGRVAFGQLMGEPPFFLPSLASELQEADSSIFFPRHVG